MRLNPIIKSQLKTRLFVYHSSLWNPPLTRELDFLNRTVNGLKNISISSGNQTISSRCKRIHLTPRVTFYRSPLLPNLPAITTELSDLLFVIKHFENGVLKEFRAILGQIKFTSQIRKSWHIDSDQFFLMTQWPRFKIVSPARFKRTFHIKPKTRTWSSYGFVGPLAVRFPIYHSAQRILDTVKKIPTTHSFTYKPPPPFGWDSSPSFILKFLEGLIGENLLTNNSVYDLIDALYKLVNWTIDPPDEFGWVNEKDDENGGMEIVEFTVNTEKENKSVEN